MKWHRFFFSPGKWTCFTTYGEVQISEKSNDSPKSTTVHIQRNTYNSIFLEGNKDLFVKKYKAITDGVYKARICSLWFLRYEQILHLWRVTSYRYKVFIYLGFL